MITYSSIHENFRSSKRNYTSPDRYSAVLQPAKVQNSKKNTSSWAAREETELEQVKCFSFIACNINVHEDELTNLPIRRYIPNATGAIYEILKEISRSRPSKKRRYEDNDEELLKQVSDKLVTAETLHEKLAQHVEQVKISWVVDKNVF